MSEWVRRWQMSVRWRPDRPGDRTAVRHVDTVAELRRLVDAARTNPDVEAYQHRPVRELVGDEPSSCRRGHPYDGGSATRAARRLGELQLRRTPRARLPLARLRRYLP